MLSEPSLLPFFPSSLLPLFLIFCCSTVWAPTGWCGTLKGTHTLMHSHSSQSASVSDDGLLDGRGRCLVCGQTKHKKIEFCPSTFQIAALWER